MVGLNFRVSNNAKMKKQIRNQILRTIVITTNAPSDTPYNTFNGLYEQRLNHLKNGILEHLNINIYQSGIYFQTLKILLLKKLIYFYYQKLK